MPRLLFEKTGNAVWISHLDLMRLFQRAFKRGGLALTHTQGFNPRPSVSIALPLSVGTQSRCELLDFELDGEAVSCDEILKRLNSSLVEGIRVLQVYENGNKIKHLSYLDCTVSFVYDGEVSEKDSTTIRELFCRPSLMVYSAPRKVLLIVISLIVSGIHGSTIRPSKSGRTPKMCCETLVNVQAAVPVNQLFLASP